MISRTRLPYLFIAPSAIILFGVALYPIIHTFFISLHQINLKFPDIGMTFIWFENYKQFVSDGRAIQALKNTIVFTVSTVALELALGMIIAILMDRAIKFRGLLRATVLIPWAIPTVVAAMLWRWMYNDQSGIVNAFLIGVGAVPEYVQFLAAPVLAWIAVIVAEVWKTTPFMALLLLAGLQIIPREIYEAGEIDGAGRIRTFIFITLPLIKPVLLVALLFRTLDAFRVFDIIFVMTGGGPGNATESLSLYTYKTMFGNLDFGYGSALSVLTFLCVAVISILYIRFIGTRTQ
jgi:multiple sugar transport system permease protein